MAPACAVCYPETLFRKKGIFEIEINHYFLRLCMR